MDLAASKGDSGSGPCSIQGMPAEPAALLTGEQR